MFPEDLEWIKAAGGYLWHVDKVPETEIQSRAEGVFSGGCGIRRDHDFDRIDHVVSDQPADGIGAVDVPPACIGFCAIFAFFFIHLYLGTIGNPGSVDAMVTGWMDKKVLTMLHPKWVREMDREGKLVAWGEEKKKTPTDIRHKEQL